MPITTDAVAISKKAVNEFIETDEYRKCKNADLIFAEFLSDDGGKLFLFEPNGVFQVNENEIDEEEFIWVSIDDEDNLGVMGQWQESPFNFDISTQMSIIVDDKSEVENLIQSFDYSILEDKAFSKICKDFIDSSLEFDDWYDETSFKKTEIILEKYNLDGGDFEDLAKSSHEKNFLKDTGFDSSNSTNSTFIGVFEPDLKALMKYKSIIEDITGDLKEFGDEVFACSTFDTYNYELIETLAEKETKITGSGFDGYEVYFMGFIETIVSEKVEEIKKEIPGIKSKKAKSRLISMIASEIENITGKNHDDARDYVLYIQQNHTRDYYSPVPLITVTSNQESTEIKSRLENLGVKIEVAGVASIKATEPYINVEVDELISYPSINAYGFSGSGANGWDGELELDKKGVSLVSLKS
jgi:hypothetical protein